MLFLCQDQREVRVTGIGNNVIKCLLFPAPGQKWGGGGSLTNGSGGVTISSHHGIMVALSRTSHVTSLAEYGQVGLKSQG